MNRFFPAVVASCLPLIWLRVGVPALEESSSMFQRPSVLTVVIFVASLVGWAVATGRLARTEAPTGKSLAAGVAGLLIGPVVAGVAAFPWFYTVALSYAWPWVGAFTALVAPAVFRRRS